MEKSNNNKVKHIDVRVSVEEYNKIYKHFEATTCQKLSEYARKIMLNKPVISTYRNQSLDDLMAELIKLRTELNAIGNNFNQAVRKLHLLNQTGQLQSWIIRYETDNDRLLQTTQTIEQLINKMADLWLQ